jgi:hypothetical protein
MRRYISFVIAMLAVIVVGALCIITLHSEDDHNLNFKYRAWKLGLTKFDSDYVRFLNVDVDFRKSLVGKQLSEIEKLFPDLRKPDKANDYQSNYSDEIDHADYRWIGDSAWVVEFKSGRVKELHIWKG